MNNPIQNPSERKRCSNASMSRTPAQARNLVSMPPLQSPNLPSSQNHHYLKKIRSINPFSRPVLYSFRSCNTPKLFLRMFPKPLHQPFLPEPGQQILHLGSETLTFQVNRVDTASYFPVGSPCDCNFTAQRDPRSPVSVRSCWVPARNLGLACSDYPEKTAS